MGLFERIFGKKRTTKSQSELPAGTETAPRVRVSKELDSKLHELELDMHGIDPYEALLYAVTVLEAHAAPMHNLELADRLVARYPQIANEARDLGVFCLGICNVLAYFGYVNHDETAWTVTLTSKGKDAWIRAREGHRHAWNVLVEHFTSSGTTKPR